jgi:putative membrane protein
MKYYDVEPDELILRDHLAAERTHLANERTLLAYLRSGFMLFITSISILKLFEGDTTFRYIAFAILPLSLFAIIFGVFRYRKVRNKLMSFSTKKKSY